ncbi:MAG: nucleotidyltransferase domain-containing protein, partial [Candidatus Helarchaeales archaeon]
MDWNEIKKAVLKHVDPDEKEKKTIQNVIKELKEALEKQGSRLGMQDYRIEAQGSTGEKQTFLRGSSDIDLFVILDKKHVEEYLRLEKKQRKSKIHDFLTQLVQEWFFPALQNLGCDDIHVSYAEHPYISARKDKFEIDVVGCFHLTQEYILKHGIITAVDRTPLHTQLIKSSLNQDQINDVKILKSFFQACRAYGDRAAIGQMGFTGFSAEILIYHFKTLENVFNNFERLQDNPIDFFSRSKKELKRIPAFKKATLIMIDPIDPRRNLAASISERSYQFVNYKIKQFFKSPSEKFFIFKPLKPIPENQLPDYPSTLVLEFKEVVSGVHYTEIRDKLYSFGRRLVNHLKEEPTREPRFGEVIFEIYFEEPNYAMILACKKSTLEKMYFHKGPEMNNADNVKKFLKKYPRACLKNGFYWVEIERTLLTLKDHVEQF